MIIGRSPLRISFFGSSSDHYSWWHKYGGCSVNATINHYSYLSIKKLPKFFDYNTKLAYSEIETVRDISEIKHNIFRKALEYFDIHDVELVHQADLFSKCGLGSSSTFAVLLMYVLSAYKNEFVDKWELAHRTIHLEQDLLREYETVGYQDTLAATFGGLNKFEYFPNGNITATPIFLDKDTMYNLQKHILLLFTGISRSSAQISSQYASELVNKLDLQKRFVEIAHEGTEEIKKGNLSKVGALLEETWQNKRQISPVISNPQIDKWCADAKEEGALSARLMGSGSGGTIMVFADPKLHQKIIHRLGLVQIGWNWDFNGAKLLYVNRNGQ